jgi:hypothetical protein
MTDDHPTFAEIGESNIRQRELRELREQEYGEPVNYYLNYLDNEAERL